MKTKLLAIVAVFLCLCGTVGYALWRANSTSSQQSSVVTGADLAADSPSVIGTKQPAIPLTSQGQALGASTSASGGVGSSLQTNIGDQASGSSNASNKAPSMPDPSTFKQYEMYKDPKYTAALFGDIQLGSGAEAGNQSNVTVVYRGYLTNGTIFDESKIDPASGKINAFQFPLGQGKVVSGWEQGIPGMKVGGTRLLIVPPSVGYGAAGHGPVPGNAVMVFEVQLVAVE